MGVARETLQRTENIEAQLNKSKTGGDNLSITGGSISHKIPRKQLPPVESPTRLLRFEDHYCTSVPYHRNHLTVDPSSYKYTIL
jgi:hypothetical protein